MTKLALKTQVTGYAAGFGGTVVGVKLDGGRARYRRDVINASTAVKVAWILGEYDYNYLMAFYATELEEGALPFEVDLKINSSTVAEYTANIVPGTFSSSQGDDGIWRASADLEVEPIPRDESADAALVAAYNAAHGE